MTDSPAKLPTENITVTLPRSGQVAVLRPYVTGRMSLATRAVFLKHMNVNPKDAFNSGGDAPTEDQARDAVTFDNIPGDAIDEINKITVEHMVITLDGKAEDVVERALDLPSSDYEFLVEQCNEIDKATTVGAEKKES